MTDMIGMVSRAVVAAAPCANVGVWAEALAAPMQACGIVTPNRVAMFVGQIVHETGGFRLLSEDLWYATAERVWLVFGRPHFADPGEAAAYVGRPQALANRVYANRMGNGDEESGDGWRYRGRGLIQLTGRSMYERFASAEPRAADPDWLVTPAGAAASACWFWTRLALNMPAEAWDVGAVTWRINGGSTGLAARVAVCEAARLGLGVGRACSDADQLMAAELQSLGARQGEV